MNELEQLRALLAEVRGRMGAFLSEELKQRIEAALAEPVVETLTIDQHKEITQKRVDHTIHYRNLAIVLGAKPNQMLTDYDKELCEKGIDPDDNSGGYHWSVRDCVEEVEDLWEKNERLERERDEARALRTVDAEKARHEAALLRMRVSDLKFVLGTDATGWFDRFKHAERERDEARAEVARLKGELKMECGFTESYVKALHKAQERAKAAYQRGAEAMREAAATAVLTRFHLSSVTLAQSIRAMPIPEDKP
jgi:hypothetical protein